MKKDPLKEEAKVGVQIAGLRAALEMHDLAMRSGKPELNADVQNVLKAAETGDVKKTFEAVISAGEKKED